METPKIYGNNHKRELLYAHQLSPCDLETVMRDKDWAFDDKKDPLDCEDMFFKYRREWYALSEFMRVEKYAPEWLQGKSGYLNDSFFSGVMIKLTEDDCTGEECVLCWTFIS